MLVFFYTQHLDSVRMLFHNAAYSEASAGRQTGGFRVMIAPAISSVDIRGTLS